MDINREHVSKNNTYVGKNHPEYIVVHETDNFSIGAGAERHAKAQAAGHLDTSVHYYTGSDGAYQAAEHEDGTWSVGVEYGGSHSVHDATNFNTINIEICVNPDGDYNKARENAINLVKYLIDQTGIPAERVIRHFDARGKYCPRNMMDSPALWVDFVKQISGDVAAQPEEVKPSETDRYYRVGTAWVDGFCQNQIGAYLVKENALAACKDGYHVFDSDGAIVSDTRSADENAEKDPDIIYAVQIACGGWLPEVRNQEDYAGIENKKIYGFMAKISNGAALEYRAHTTGGYWLPWVTGYNINDLKNGYAGDGKTPIDAVEIKCGGHAVKYKASSIGNGTSYYPVVDSGQNDYAGVFGKPLDKIMCCLE